MRDANVELLTRELEEKLMVFYGSPVLSGIELQKALGYRSIDALRQAILRKQFPVPVFCLANRRGKFALVKDIASYLAENSLNNICNERGESDVK